MRALLKCAALIVVGAFTVAAPAAAQHFDVLAPVENAQLRLGSIHTIRWRPHGVSGYLKILLVQNGREVGVIRDMVPIARQQYAWRVGRVGNQLTERARGGHRIKLTSMAGGVEGLSGRFYLAPNMIVFASAAGTAWPAGRPMTIKGVALGYNKAVNLELWHHKTFKGRIAQGLSINNRQFLFDWPVGQLLNGSSAKLDDGYYIKAVAATGHLAAWSPAFQIVLGPSPVDPSPNTGRLRNPAMEALENR